MMGLVVGGATAQRFIGSVVDKQHSKSMGPHPPGVLTDNATIGTFPGKHDGDGSRLDSYIIILAIVSTIFPLICLILSLVIARRLWVKYRGERCATVEREDTAQTSLKSRDGGSRKSSRASRVTKDPNSRDQLIPQTQQSAATQDANDTTSLYQSKLSLVPPPPSPQAGV
ncbi:uncharacterized protein LOC126991863 isoform X2 [Eriocheir sinensis]|uniref:uncharacterized protein LOC126991863 isoform X2 n=1 Tax=Eriocheir sinensis TaxID=95602 RepID=UPI0021C9A94D|nr:uncharacterized protein LOC126991863 isoform X2 [Eriocheir sinensis]